MKYYLCALFLGFGLFGTIHARSWTSADGSKTFSGKLISYDTDTSVVQILKTNGRKVKFEVDKLSDKDIAFLDQWVAENKKNEGPNVEEILAEQKFGAKVLKMKLHKLEGSTFAKAKMEKTPEYYLLYFTASW